MAIVAAVMQLLPISSDQSVMHVASAVRNVCNATLSLLFTIALFIWGVLVNRRQAWRTDGGTAVFGCAALSLALISTALNFIYVHRGEENIAWLQSLMWAVVLWQSFLGWWWWVGAGSGSGLGGDEDLEEKLRREAKRENRRREARERRQETKKRAKKVWREVTGAFGREGGATIGESRRRAPRGTSPAESVPHSPARTSASSTVGSTVDADLPLVPPVIRRIYASVRRAHLIAAQKQTAERVERIREIQRNGVSDASRTTWGVGNLIRTAAPLDHQDEIRRYPNTDWEGNNERDRFEMYETSEWGQGRRSRRAKEDDEVVDQPISEEEEEERGRSLSRRSGRRRQEEEEEEEQYGEDDGGREPVRVDTSPATTAPNSPVIEPDTRTQSFWWWGPLRRWRLRDSTAYS